MLGWEQACPHFSGKARAWESIRKAGLSCAATVEAPIYYQNMELTKFQTGPILMGFSRNDDGTATLHCPVLDKDDKAPWFDVNQIGECPYCMVWCRLSGQLIRHPVAIAKISAHCTSGRDV